MTKARKYPAMRKNLEYIGPDHCATCMSGERFLVKCKICKRLVCDRCSHKIFSTYEPSDSEIFVGKLCKKHIGEGDRT